MEKKSHISPWYFVVGLLVMLAVQALYWPPRTNTLPYSDFKSLLKEGKVRNVVIGSDSISGKLKGSQQLQNATPEPNTAAARKPHGADAQHQFVTARVSDLFAQAQQRAPCIIFIDELDALGKARGASPVGGHDEREQTLNQLLVGMDGFETDKSIIIMAATNRPEMLDGVSKISIIPRGVAAFGYTQQLPTEDRYLLKKSELLDRLDVLLGGRVAEEIVFGDVSTGAQNDLQRATDMARLMMTQYGMSERLGLATFEQQSPSMFLNAKAPMQQGQHEYSERTTRTIDAGVHKLLDEAHARVSRTLAAQRATLDTLSALLLEKEVVDREALMQIPRMAEIESRASAG